MSTIEQLPEDVLGAVRQYLGAEDENDTKYDARIEQMNADSLFRSYLKWNGIINYEFDIRRALHSIEDARGGRKKAWQ